MHLNEWLSILSERTQPGVVGLDRVHSVAMRLHLLPVSYQVLTVGGTNGKGSSVAFASTLLHLSNKKVGTYTSPHLLRYNERIAIDLKPVSDADIVSAFKAIEQARGETYLSYFEFSFLAALYLFRKANIEVAVLEVGLGGRLDCVNIIDADVAMVCTVDFDHMDYLGHTLEAIAYEKAGIFRPHRPAIYGDLNLAQSMLKHAAAIDAPLYSLGKAFSFTEHASTWDFASPLLNLSNLPIAHIHLPNAATVLMALSVLPGFVLERDIVVQALETVSVSGRQQLIKAHCNVLLDVSHNPQAAALLAKRIAGLPKLGKVYAIFSALADKDIKEVLAHLLPYIDTWYIATLPSTRAASIECIQSALSEAELVVCDSIASAWVKLHNTVEEQDWIIVFGSFYTVAAVIEELKDETNFAQ